MAYADPEKQLECYRRYYSRHSESLRQKAKEYRQANPEKKREWRKKNSGSIKESSRQYYLKNKEIVAEQHRVWREANRDYPRRYQRDRRKIDVNFRLAGNLRRRLRAALKADSKSGSAVQDLDCPIGSLKSWMMYQFEEGMTLENYGKWHMDHVKPLASFDLTDREQFLEACHWTNYQPLWAADNLSKGAREEI